MPPVKPYLGYRTLLNPVFRSTAPETPSCKPLFSGKRGHDARLLIRRLLGQVGHRHSDTRIWIVTKPLQSLVRHIDLCNFPRRCRRTLVALVLFREVRRHVDETWAQTTEPPLSNP